MKLTIKVKEKTAENMYLAEVKRHSRVKDTLQIKTYSPLEVGDYYSCSGCVIKTESYYLHDKRKLNVYVEVETALGIIKPQVWDNDFKFIGTICKLCEPRVTPFGKTITNFVLAVNHENGTSSYVPCIFFDKIESVKVGDKIMVMGRLQSRDYVNQKGESGTAYELAVRKIAKEVYYADTNTAKFTINEKGKESENE